MGDVQTEKTPEQLRAEQATRDQAAADQTEHDRVAAAERAVADREAAADKAKQEAIDKARVADAERAVDVKPAILPDDKMQSEPVSLAPGSASADPPREVPAAERLRAFEDQHFGKDAVRISGRIERGSGSPYQAMGAEQKRQYVALEKLIEAEQKLADAHAALIQAEADHEAALAAAEPKPDVTE